MTHWVGILIVFLWFIIIPVAGIVILPLLTPYLLKRKLYKQIKPFPSFIPYWLTIVLLVYIMNNVWTNYFNGKIFYEWDTGFVQYSLLHYESPILDGLGTWIANGWSLLGLYFLWTVVTAGIYLIATFVSLTLNQKEENFQLYKKVIIKSSLVLFIIGLFVTALFNLLIKR